MTAQRNELARQLGDLCRLKGRFTLRSGQTSATYFDKYLFEGDPGLLKQIAVHMVPLVPDDTEVLAGLELGGIPVVTALSLESGIPASFVRKQAKPYGTARLAEGADIAGRQVLVVEDIITTGGQAARSTADLRNLGARIDHVLCVIDRSGGDCTQLNAIGVRVNALFTGADVGEG